jgi:hypothetical protein
VSIDVGKTSTDRAETLATPASTSLPAATASTARQVAANFRRRQSESCGASPSLRGLRT